MKKILMIAPTPFFSDRGCHVRVLNSYHRLEQEDSEILLLTYPIGRNIDGVDLKRVPGIPGYKKLSPGFSIFKPVLDFFLMIMSIRAMRKGRYDELYCHLHEGALVGIFTKIFFKTKVIFDCQGSLTGELKSNKDINNKFILKMLYGLEKWIVRKCDKIIVSNDSIKKMIDDEMNPRDEVIIMPDIPDSAVFNKKVKPVDIPLKKGIFKVVYLGGLKKNKGIDYLLDAIPLTDEKIHFLIFGFPLDYVSERISVLKIENRITLQGPIPYEEAGRYIAAGSIAVSPKMTDESGEANAKIYSYKAVGLKVICFDSVENREIAGKNGYYAKPGDSADLAKQINLSYRDFKNAGKK